MISWRGTLWARAVAGCFALLAIAASRTNAGGWSAPDPRENAVRETVLMYLRDTGVVGCAVAVAEKGRVVFSEGFGFADLETPAEATPETLFRLASVSKPITAFGVMKLVENGRVDLDADIRKYVPEFPDKGHTITVAQILSHTSGIRHYKNGEFASTKRYESVVESLNIFKDDPLVHKPGEAYLYTTYGYTLLARLVENVTDKPFPRYLQEDVFAALGMKNSRVDDARAIIPNRAKGYKKGADGKPVNCDFADTSYKWAGGGMLSSASDMVNFGIALLSAYHSPEGVLSHATIERMWTSTVLPNGNKTRYGLGFHVNEIEGKRMISHTGSQQGSQTALLIFPEQDVVIVVLTNYESHNAMELARKVAEAWVGISAKAPLAGTVRS